MIRARPPALLAIALSAFFALPSRGLAQDRIRLGVSVGGIGFAALVAEGIWEDRSVEVMVGTFTFHDVSLSVVGKQFFGAGWLKPAIGGGLWYLRGASAEGTGSALVLRFPLGGDWQVADGHYITWEVNVARGLAVRRPDPTDDAPMSTRIIPLPSLSYRVDPGRF